MGIHAAISSDPEALPIGSDGRRWYVVHAFTGREKEADAHLRNQGFDTFNPIEIRTVRHARRLVTKSRAFFPGYLFVRIDVDLDRWRSINGTRGVRSLIMQAERPVACPRGLVERLVEAADPDGVIDTRSTLRPGQKVKVKTGPFADLVGTLDRLDNSGRAKVLLEIMSGERAVSMAGHDLEAL
ncbi:transcription termination/antitermination NusG family protein [Aquibium sp. ELW1220]|uniref:transcription termination/antitermination protein NusG n=1 Tax=Aquibium sp. ELW1220 TaxID=2976766 RepID=UPI0025B15053|nr:transcription termination/antitermination NusG family protein [Aquibium sp. ELW1220]MDN2583031.1 transcription antiterminator NusG [Aquibium sp. ELW1220]